MMRKPQIPATQNTILANFMKRDYRKGAEFAERKPRARKRNVSGLAFMQVSLLQIRRNLLGPGGKSRHGSYSKPRRPYRRNLHLRSRANKPSPAPTLRPANRFRRDLGAATALRSQTERTVLNSPAQPLFANKQSTQIDPVIFRALAEVAEDTSRRRQRLRPE